MTSTKTTQRTDLVVVGGGPAGMMAAWAAASRGNRVALLEPNRQLGRKLRITGKGRCNLTNNCDVREFLKNVPRNPKFLYSALNALSPSDTMLLFEQQGLPLKTERGRRVFPVSDDANDVARVLESMLHDSGVQILKTRAKRLLLQDGAVTGVLTEQGSISSSAVLLSTGGCSYPGTGSTGDGLRFARQAGHSVVEIRPSLVPLESPDGFCAQMQGFSLRNVTLRVYNNKNERIFSELGEMLFTHFGVSGPLVLSASAHMRDFASDSYRLSVDLKPGLDEQQLDARILRDFEKYKNRSFSNALGDLAGRSMIPVLIQLSGIPPETRVNEITRQQRKALVTLFKEFPIRISGPRPIAEAIVSSGGVDVREVDPRRMASRLVEGLFFAGEILDVDAYTGGYNLQIAWSTGYVAGSRCNGTD